NLHRERDLAEVLAGAQDAPTAERVLRDGRNPGEEDVEAVAVLALADDGRTGGDLVSLHQLSELRQGLAGELREETDTRELGHARRDVSGAHGSLRKPRAGKGAGNREVPHALKKKGVARGKHGFP